MIDERRCRTRTIRRLLRPAVTLVLALPFLLGVQPGRSNPLPNAAPVPRQPTDWRSEVAAPILALLETAGDGHFDGIPASERTELEALYAPGSGRALWIDTSGRLTGDSREALALLAAASDDGLDPADYGLETLTALAAAVTPAPTPDRERLAAFDLLLSAGTVRYLRQLHRGRVDPRTIGVSLALEPERHDVVRLLQGALTTHGLRAVAASLAPPLPQYQALRRHLVRYRSLGEPADPSWPPIARTIRPGDRFQAADTLRRRLVALGDLPASTLPAAEADAYDEALSAGVSRFQARHGLAADGVLGRATQAALAVPMRSRIRQIELALERLRWLPDVGAERVVALNIPMFRLVTWDGASAPDSSLRMRAIVGRALITETPVFTAMMRSVVFRPYWNVPRSILLGEILPALESDPRLLRRDDFEIVDGQSDEAHILSPTPEALAQLRAGMLRLRQRPGPANALGLVKFDFPNAAGVYLHGTPARELFARPRRDFSHGCVRVEDPAALAEWVLRDEPGWDRHRIDAAMAATVSSHVALSKPIRVVLFYTTAAVVSEDGALHFADDIYGHDARLEDALARTRHPSSSGSQKLKPRKSNAAASATARSTPTIRSISTEVASNVPRPPGMIPTVRNRLAIMKLAKTPVTAAVWTRSSQGPRHAAGASAEDQFGHGVEFERLVDNAERAERAGRLRQLRRAERRHQQHSHGRPLTPDAGQQAEPVAVRQVNVEHGDVEASRVIAQCRHGGLHIGRLDDDGACIAERLRQRPPDQHFVVDDQDPDAGGILAEHGGPFGGGG